MRRVRLRRRLGLSLPLLFRRSRRRRRLGLLPLLLLALLPAESYGLDHLRLAVAVLQGLRGPVREFEPPPLVLVAPVSPQKAVQGHPTRVRVRVHAHALLGRPQVDDGGDVRPDAVDSKHLQDCLAVLRRAALLPLVLRAPNLRPAPAR